MDWTVEIHKIDKRHKEGKVLVEKIDHTNVTFAEMERMYPRRPRYIVLFFETYVTKRNLMGGGEFRERYDTPYYCSPSSESYWSM